jgi:DNA-binding transcriptional ArsR family regulator
MRRDIFQAIADPTRREIIHMISQRSMTPNAIADKFDVTRQAVSKHLRILAECGVILVERQGRERYCHARLERLGEVDRWLDQYRKFLEASFDRLDDYLKDIQTKKRKTKNKRR